MKIILCIIAILCLAPTGCLNFKKAGSDLSEGATRRINQKRDSLSEDMGVIVRGARDTLLGTATEERLAHLINSIGNVISDKLGMTRDNILGDKTRVQLDSIAGNLGKYLSDYRDDLVGDKTTERLSKMVDQAIVGKLSEVGTILRNELLGKEARVMVDTLVAAAVGSIARAYEDSLQPVVHKEKEGIEKGAGKLLWLIGGISAGLIALIGLIYYIFRSIRHKRVLEILTLQIHCMEDQGSYDELTGRIKASATEAGVEPHLRALLKKRGLLGAESWKTTISKKTP
jgi:hypothetical protein